MTQDTQDTQNTQSYWDQYEQRATNDMASGGDFVSLIAHIEVQAGWKAFAGGTSNEDSWFPANPADKQAWRLARKAANALCDEGRFASSGITIIADKDKCYTKSEKKVYEQDRHFYRSEYHELTIKKDDDGTPRGHKVLFSALRAASVTVGYSGWASLARVANPYYKAKGDEEKVWDKAITVVTETFKNFALAKKAIAEMPKGDEDDGSVGPYTAEDWAAQKDDVVKALDEQTPDEVAADYGVDVSYIQAIADDIVPV